MSQFVSGVDSCSDDTFVAHQAQCYSILNIYLALPIIHLKLCFVVLLFHSMDCLSCEYFVSMICCSILSEYNTVGSFSGTAFQPYMYISYKVLFSIELLLKKIIFDLMFDSHFLMIILLLLYRREVPIKKENNNSFYRRGTNPKCLETICACNLHCTLYMYPSTYNIIFVNRACLLFTW